MKHKTWLSVAKVIAENESKCISKKVCAIIVKDDRLVSTGHNGTAKGQPNCCDVNAHLLDSNGCLSSEDSKNNHHHWSNIHEIHAEINAIMYSSHEQRNGATLYCTLFPCFNCAKAIAGSGIKKVVYSTFYERTPKESIEVLENAGIEILHIPE